MSTITYEQKAAYRDPSLERARRIAAYAEQVAGQDDAIVKEANRQGQSARRIECPELGLEFRCVSEAERELGFKASNIRSALRSGGTTSGVHFRHVDGASLEPVDSGRLRRVECVETRQQYRTMSEAARAHDCPTSTLFDAVKYGYAIKLASGDRIHFRYIESNPIASPRPKAYEPPKPVQRVVQMTFEFASPVSPFNFSA